MTYNAWLMDCIGCNLAGLTGVLILWHTHWLDLLGMWMGICSMCWIEDSPPPALEALYHDSLSLNE